MLKYDIDMQDVYKNIEKYNIGKKRRILILLIWLKNVEYKKRRILIRLLIWLIIKK